jgi:multiple sugar transport system permease protein
MSSWRTLALIVVGLVVAYFLYPSSEKPRNEKGIEPEEITLWYTGNSPDAVRTAAELFEQKTGGKYRVLVGNAAVKNSTEDASRFLLGVAGGAPPDLIYYDRFAVVEGAQRGAFTDLTPLIEADEKANPSATPWKQRFFDSMWREANFNGKQFAIPATCDTRSLLISDDDLERAGFKDATGKIRYPETWEDLCRKKAHGKAKVTGNTVAFAGKAEGIEVDDMVTLRPQGRKEVFRARIGKINADGSWELSPSTKDGEKEKTVPALFAGADIETKVFDKNSYAIKLTRFDGDGEFIEIGFSPLFGNSHLYMFGWENGATYMSKDGRTCELAQTQVAEALQFIVDTYDAMGGYERVTAFEGSFQTQAQDPFLLGKVAMRVDGDWFLNTIAAFKPDLRFSAIWAPIPKKRLDAGYEKISWVGGWAYAIPATAKKKEAAWELLKYLMSMEGLKAQAEVDAGIARGKGKPYLPPLNPHREYQEWSKKENVLQHQQVNQRLRNAYVVFDEMLGAMEKDPVTGEMVPRCKYRPVTPVGQKLWNAHMLAQQEACNHTYEVDRALHIGERNVQHALDRVLNPPSGSVLSWKIVFVLYGIVVAAGIAGAIWAEKRHRAKGLGKRDWLMGYLGISPWLIGFLVFSLGPILFSLLISFCNWDVLNEAKFTGLDNYQQLLGSYTDPKTGEVVANDPEFWKSLGNTAFMIISVPLGIALGLGIALLLNTAVKGMAFFRTIYYLPAIVPAVATFLIWIWVFNHQRGIVNMTLRSVGIAEPPKWLQSSDWSKPALIIMGLWGVGGGMLIWLAGLKNIPQQLYEAAEIDGAGPMRRFFHITLPMLSPYIFFNFVLGLIGVFQIFEAAYMMTNGGPSNSTLFYAYKLFNEAFRYLNMGTAAAMAWIMFVIVMGLTLLNLWAGKRWVHYE